jgi:hypothetical protein
MARSLDADLAWNVGEHTVDPDDPPPDPSPT